jgi:penicillin-binding protein 1A
VFANGGRSVNPYGIYKIVDSAGNLLYQRDDSADGLGVFDSRPISELDSMLRAVVREGTGTAAQMPYNPAGKTGTTEDFHDAWFIGYTDHYVAAVWLGNDDNSPMKHVAGGSYPTRIWHDVMLAAEEHGGSPSTPQDSVPPHRDGLQNLFRHIFTFN